MGGFLKGIFRKKISRVKVTADGMEVQNRIGNASANEILVYVTGHPDSTVKQIAEELEMDEVTVRQNIINLVDNGLLAESK